MKVKMILSVFAFLMVFGLSAQNPQRGQGQGKGTNCSKVCFVDLNNNGICDNYENGTCQSCSGKANAQCVNKSINNGKKGNKNVQGCKGMGNRNCNTSCTNFVDENKNGICDKKE